jgi:DnaK suppressor protein
MSTKELVQFRNMLVSIRTEILERILQMEASWKSLSEREIELEEEVQKAAIAQSYSRLGDEGKTKIELIELALNKILVGEYGVCDSCGDDIPFKRLEALPWTRLCIDCARENERKPVELPEPGELQGTSPVPDDLNGLTTNQLLRTIVERIEEDGQLDGTRLNISIKSGVVYLDGTVASELEHQVLLQVLQEDMGFHAVTDRLKVSEEDWNEGSEGSIPIAGMSGADDGLGRELYA